MNFRFRDNWLWYLLVVLLMASNVYLLIGRFAAQKELDQVVAAERVQGLEKEKAVLQEQLEGKLSQDMLLYSDLVMEDLNDQRWKSIRAQFQRITSLTSAKSIEIIDGSGKVKVSNDKKQEGRNKSTEYDSRILFDDQAVHYKHLPTETISTMRLIQDTTFLGYLVMHYSDVTANVSPH